MKMTTPLINLGDTAKMLTNKESEVIITEVSGEVTVFWKADIPEFITALFGAYIDSASSADVASLVKGIRRKLDIRKSRDTKNA